MVNVVNNPCVAVEGRSMQRDLRQINGRLEISARDMTQPNQTICLGPAIVGGFRQ